MSGLPEVLRDTPLTHLRNESTGIARARPPGGICVVERSRGRSFHAREHDFRLVAGVAHGANALADGHVQTRDIRFAGTVVSERAEEESDGRLGNSERTICSDLLGVRLATGHGRTWAYRLATDAGHRSGPMLVSRTRGANVLPQRMRSRQLARRTPRVGRRWRAPYGGVPNHGIADVAGFAVVQTRDGR